MQPRRGLAGTVVLVLASSRVVHAVAELVVTEVMHNPTNGSNYEFLEFRNIGDETIELAGAHFTEGIEFTFPLDDPGTLIGPGEFVIVVNDLDSFALLYGAIETSGEYTGNLNNEGEQVRLLDIDENLILEFQYDDGSFWPVGPAGFGYSLVPIDPRGNLSDPENWRASADVDGSPGADDPERLHAGIVINEVLTHTDLPFEDAIELRNITSGAIDISGWFLSDDRNDVLTLKKFVIPDGTVIPANGLVVFYEYQFNSDPGDPRSFALSSEGDDVYLASADGTGELTGYIRGFAFGPAAAAVSFGRFMTTVGVDLATLSERTFGVDDPASVEQFRNGAGEPNADPLIGPVIISELHYHPLNDVEEFTELYNLSGADIELFDHALQRGWELDGLSNVGGTDDFEFASGDIIPAGGRMLIVPIFPEDYRAIYGIGPDVPIVGPYSGSLSNDGERITLGHPDMPDVAVVHYAIDTVRYNDKAPWPAAADGDGPSLERIAASAYANDPVNWAASLVLNGTPGEANTVSHPIPDVDGSGTVDFGDLLLVLSAWGPCQGCPEDVDRSGNVDFADILLILAAWGPVE